MTRNYVICIKPRSISEYVVHAVVKMFYLPLCQFVMRGFPLPFVAQRALMYHLKHNKHAPEGIVSCRNVESLVRRCV